MNFDGLHFREVSTLSQRKSLIQAEVRLKFLHLDSSIRQGINTS